MDWKSSLSALRDSMPEPEAEETADAGATADAAKEQPYAAQRQRLDIILDRKGRKGKEATIVVGFTLDDEQVAAVASRLKQRLGVGGSSRGGEILIQGDKRKAVLDALTALGLKARII